MDAPELSPVPKRRKRLVDTAMMHIEASRAGGSERYGRGQTSHTLHVWWARRPHSAMRGLVFASLCRKPDASHAELMMDLFRTNTGERAVLARCADLLCEQYGGRPKVLDMFGGGGTIPLEAANLGADVSSIDINEMSVFIQKSNLAYLSPDETSALIPVVEACGRRMLERLRDATSVLYPLRGVPLDGTTRGGPIVYHWTYAQTCPACGFKAYAIQRPWLSRKAGRATRIEQVEEGGRNRIRLVAGAEGSAEGRVRAERAKACKHCGGTLPDPDVRTLEDALVAVAYRRQPTGKRFSPAPPAAVPEAGLIHAFEAAYLKEFDLELPTSRLPRWSGIVNPALYGIDTHADFLNPRQRAVLVALIGEIKRETAALASRGKRAQDFVLGALSGLLDQIIDWNCRLSMWIPQNEQVGRAFCGPGVAMLWDYAEADPLLDGPANLWRKLERIVAGLAPLALRTGTVEVTHESAKSMHFQDDAFDAIVTDPPYYDNIFYSVLSDFFYAWKRLLLREAEPGLFSSPATAGGGTEELVASSNRSGNARAAHDDYCTWLAQALNEASRVLKPDGVVSFLYTHASLGGWTSFIAGFRNSPLTISSAQPLSIERKARPRAMTSEAVNTCIVFIARKGAKAKPVRTFAELKADFGRILAAGFEGGLEASGWNPEDIAIALYAQGAGLLANLSAVKDAGDVAVLDHCEQRIKAKYPGFKINKRNPL